MPRFVLVGCPVCCVLVLVSSRNAPLLLRNDCQSLAQALMACDVLGVKASCMEVERRPWGSLSIDSCPRDSRCHKSAAKSDELMLAAMCRAVRPKESGLARSSAVDKLRNPIMTSGCQPTEAVMAWRTVLPSQSCCDIHGPLVLRIDGRILRQFREA